MYYCSRIGPGVFLVTVVVKHGMLCKLLSNHNANFTSHFGENMFKFLGVNMHSLLHTIYKQLVKMNLYTIILNIYCIVSLV